MTYNQKKIGVVALLLAIGGFVFWRNKKTKLNTSTGNGTGSSQTGGGSNGGTTGGGGHTPLPTDLSQYDGQIDAVAPPNAYLKGWVVNVNNPSEKVKVDVWVNGQKNKTLTANIQRTDLDLYLSQTWGLVPQGSIYGFEYQIPRSVINMGDNVIEVFIADTKTPITNSPYHFYKQDGIVTPEPTPIVTVGDVNNFYGGSGSTSNTSGGGRTNTLQTDF